MTEELKHDLKIVTKAEKEGVKCSEIRMSATVSGPIHEKDIPWVLEGLRKSFDEAVLDLSIRLGPELEVTGHELERVTEE